MTLLRQPHLFSCHSLSCLHKTLFVNTIKKEYIQSPFGINSKTEPMGTSNGPFIIKVSESINILLSFDIVKHRSTCNHN